MNTQVNITSQRGLTLLEILIAILVMGVGALGVASMQITGMKYNAGSQTRTQASLLASDMMDRIRANRQIAVDTVLYNTQGFESSADAPGTDCYTTNCSGTDIVAYDKWAWLQQVSTLLPNGSAEITVSDVNGQRMYLITLRWRYVANEQGGDADEEFQQFIYRTVI